MGAMDGKHIEIQCPPGTGSQFYSVHTQESEEDVSFAKIHLPPWNVTNILGLFVKHILYFPLFVNKACEAT